MPRPAQVARQHGQGTQRLGKDGTDGESSERSHPGTLGHFLERSNPSGEFDVRLRWNDLGSPSSILPSDGSLGVADGQVAYVSSSLTRADSTPPAAVLSPVQGWLKAAANVG